MEAKNEKSKNPFTVEVESEVKTDRENLKKVVKPEEIPPILLKKPMEPKLETKVQSKRQWGMFWWGILTIMLLELVGVGAWWGYQSQQNKPEATPTPVAVETPIAAPEPVKVELVREAITVDVYNGSGKTGLAGEVAEKFKNLGYQMGKIGNAELRQGNLIQLSDDLASMSAEILVDVQEVIGEASVDAKRLSGESVVGLILGQD